MNGHVLSFLRKAKFVKNTLSLSISSTYNAGLQQSCSPIMSKSNQLGSLWQKTEFFKGFLTSRWRFRELGYVVLASSSSQWTQEEALSECGSRNCNPFCQSPIREGPAAIQFFMFRRSDVEAPPLKYIVEPQNLDRCFFMCEEENCTCQFLHVKKGAWRLRVDALSAPTKGLVSFNEEHVVPLTDENVIPTAGYYYALGLLAEGFPAVFPRICPLGIQCQRNTCLFVHLSHHTKQTSEPLTASVKLESLLPSGLSTEVRKILVARGLETVGDIQMLSTEASETWVNQASENILNELIAITTCRFFNEHSPLAKVLATFPHVSPSVTESIQCFRTVSDVLKLSPAELYSLPLDYEIVNAFEIIRRRMEPGEPYGTVRLDDLDADSFLTQALAVIRTSASQHAHCSWRKHDAHRPVVTSVITYVDTSRCNCGGKAYSDKECFPDEPATTLLRYDRPLLPAPHGSWCVCPRMYETAFNYELNTPMGSRCSEQNAMASIARSGTPTWSIREVVVHGKRDGAEMNPLFPCGVCENMLRKVEKDVRKCYGANLMLYMFDATEPTKAFSLPLREISFRDNPKFKRLIGEE